ncbi:sensor domain-containing protein [Glycomyces arizonensis]|uniref:sensor domain-containing protein n=1 Tax=Glycomyces arizonensis TaxID=256035 RepID=UPI00041D8496|nr:sensor domain-containing protein [Glycomyces arizonensis]
MNKTFKQVGIDTTYLLSSFPIALPAFVIAVTGFSVGIGTAVIWVGVPVLAATLLAMRGLAAAGRVQLPAVLGQEVATPRYKRAPANATALRRFLTAITDGQSWLNLLWGVINFPVAVVGFALTLAWWAATVSALAYPLYGWIILRAVGEDGGNGLEYATRWLGWGDSYGAVAALTFLGGAVLALLLPLILRVCALMQAGIGRGLLASLPEIEAPEGRDDLERRLGTLDEELTRVREQFAKA